MSSKKGNLTSLVNIGLTHKEDFVQNPGQVFLYGLQFHKHLMEVLQVLDRNGKLPEGQTEFESYLEPVAGLVVESSEILDALNKEHRIWARDRELREDVEAELIDVLFYFFELTIFLKLEPEDIFARYLSKFGINLTRYISAAKKMKAEGEEIDEEHLHFAVSTLGTFQATVREAIVGNFKNEENNVLLNKTLTYLKEFLEHVERDESP